MTTIETLKHIVKRDLKLDPGAQIADDMPLSGGDHDIDSLDILLLVTSIEKEFAIRIPNESVTRDVFLDMQTLARFVDANRNVRA